MNVYMHVCAIAGHIKIDTFISQCIWNIQSIESQDVLQTIAEAELLTKELSCVLLSLLRAHCRLI